MQQHQGEKQALHVGDRGVSTGAGDDRQRSRPQRERAQPEDEGKAPASRPGDICIQKPRRSGEACGALSSFGISGRSRVGYCLVKSVNRKVSTESSVLLDGNFLDSTTDGFRGLGQMLLFGCCCCCCCHLFTQNHFRTCWSY